jgi:hypothetical protein
LRANLMLPLLHVFSEGFDVGLNVAPRSSARHLSVAVAVALAVAVGATVAVASVAPAFLFRPASCFGRCRWCGRRCRPCCYAVALAATESKRRRTIIGFAVGSNVTLRPLAVTEANVSALHLSVVVDVRFKRSAAVFSAASFCCGGSCRSRCP